MQGYILSSFFWGYITTQIIGGYISGRIGGKLVFGIGIAITSILTIITPFVAETNVYLFLALRIIEGVFEVKIKKSDYELNFLMQFFSGCDIPVYSCSLVQMGTTIGTKPFSHDCLLRQLCWKRGGDAIVCRFGGQMRLAKYFLFFRHCRSDLVHCLASGGGRFTGY